MAIFLLGYAKPFFPALLYSAFFGICIEVVQMFFEYRTASIGDMIVDTAASLMGLIVISSLMKKEYIKKIIEKYF